MTIRPNIMVRCYSMCSTGGYSFPASLSSLNDFTETCKHIFNHFSFLHVEQFIFVYKRTTNGFLNFVSSFLGDQFVPHFLSGFTTENFLIFFTTDGIVKNICSLN